MSDQRPMWRLLPVSTAGIPNLLISSTFTSQSYTVRITDLANVWTETMDRKSLVRRGLEEDISIDLTDGADQIRRMLDYLRAAFEPSDLEHKNTSLSLSKDDGNEESLVMQITCVLPSVLNLKPLEWPMVLTKSPPSTVAAALVLPLVQVHQEWRSQIEMLTAALREKDSIITRLVDKLEDTGTGLEHVFTALAGKRKVTRALAEQRVKGLAPFSESDFQNKSGDATESSGTDAVGLLDSVFGGPGLKSTYNLDEPVVPDGWWRKLGHGKNLTLVDRIKRKQSSFRLSPGESGSYQDDKDEFQVQSSPPGRNRRRVASPKLVPPPQQPDDEETSSGEDSDNLDSGSTLLPQPKPPASRIGAIGGTKQAVAPSRPRLSARPTPSPKRPVQDDSDTASDSDDDGKAPAPHASSQSASSSLPNRGGIGRIGGIGGIGGSVKQPAQPAARSPCSTPEEIRGRSRGTTEEHVPPKPRPRETSAERADRKRQELRREQEARAAAGPAKKKRRF